MQNKLSKQIILVIAVLIGLVILVAPFYDFAISSALFNPNSGFGKVLASYGEMPIFLAISASGMLLIMSDQKQRLSIKIIGSILVMVACGLFVYFPIDFNPSLNIIVAIVIAIISMVGFNLLVYYGLKDCDKDKLRKYAYLLIALVALSFLTVEIMKHLWARPRMRMIAVTPQASFQDFWVMGSGMKEQLMAIGIKSEEFKSFPSAHSGDAAMLFAITSLPFIDAKFKNKQNLLFSIALIWTALVAFSRIIVGAHFVSDVSVGIMVTLIIYLGLIYKFFYEMLSKKP